MTFQPFGTRVRAELQRRACEIRSAAELDALPVGAVVAYVGSISDRPEYRKFGPFVWGRFGDSRMYAAPEIYDHIPLRLIWHPDWAMETDQ